MVFSQATTKAIVSVAFVFVTNQIQMKTYRENIVNVTTIHVNVAKKMD
jgi:hypothetical protein